MFFISSYYQSNNNSTDMRNSLDFCLSKRFLFVTNVELSDMTLILFFIDKSVTSIDFIANRIFRVNLLLFKKTRKEIFCRQNLVGEKLK